jgi:hypothetical protein
MKKTVVIPAVTIPEKTNTVHLCDACLAEGKEVPRESSRFVCYICKKDLCAKHGNPHYISGGDYNDYCTCKGSHTDIFTEAVEEVNAILNAVPDFEELLDKRLGIKGETK